RPPLPGADFLNHTVGDGRDQLRRDLHAVDLFQMPLDLARGHPPRVERNDLVVEAVEARLPLFAELRLQLSLAVPRHPDRDLSLLALERLTRLAVARVAGVLSFRRVLLVAEMMRQLSVLDPFDERLGELLEQTALTEQVFGFLIVFQKLIEDVFRDGHNGSFPRKLFRALWPFTQNF